MDIQQYLNGVCYDSASGQFLVRIDTPFGNVSLGTYTNVDIAHQVHATAKGLNILQKLNRHTAKQLRLSYQHIETLVEVSFALGIEEVAEDDAKGYPEAFDEALSWLLAEGDDDE